MRKIIVVAILMIFTLSCKQHKEEIINNKYETVTFKGLDSINSKSIIEIKEYLKNKGFVFLTKQSDSEQWKLDNQEDIIQFNGKGTLLFMTLDKGVYSLILSDIKKSDYKFTGTSEKNGAEVDSYSKDNQTILISTIINTNTNQSAKSFVLIN
jgi:hypothetical protein